MEGVALKNLELKAFRPTDTGKAFLDAYFVEVLEQRDTYYETDRGRLKLREEKDKEAYIVRYDRTDEAEARICSYDFYPVPDISLFHAVFDGALKKECVVKKKRSLYLYENARIHLDEVEGLKERFIEIEVVIRSEEQLAQAPQLMDDLRAILHILPEDVLTQSYREMVLNKI